MPHLAGYFRATITGPSFKWLVQKRCQRINASYTGEINLTEPSKPDTSSDLALKGFIH